MSCALSRILSLAFCALVIGSAQEVGGALDGSTSTSLTLPDRLQSTTVLKNSQSSYYWRTTSVADTAQLVTLFCRSCVNLDGQPEDLPLVAVLRDTLGDNNPENDRLTSVWLLSYTRPNFGQRLLSAIPFFYWRVGDGSKSVNDTAPLFDLTAPRHPIVSEVGRDLLQWTMLDPMTTPVRASSRAYRTNELDHERLHLEEAVSYLRQAPVDDDPSALTRTQVDTVIARLELRKRLLGGFVAERRAANVGEESGFEQERIRSRNWELLRQCAERTGLLFEPIDLGGATGQYGVLWFPQGQPSPSPGASTAQVWKLLNIRDPWSDERLSHWKGPIYTRWLNETGGLAMPGEPGAQKVQLVPLGVYSLTYPRLPLLLIDFRDKLHVRGHEMTQRSINEITAGVIGISHFTNWYYYVAADLYDFVVRRHGGAIDQAARLDSYSQFRVALALDRQVDPDLRDQMQRRVNALTVNPLEVAPGRELQSATARYAKLQLEAGDGGPLVRRLDNERGSELASFGETKKARFAEALLHDASFGLYTHRARKSPDNLALLESYRRVQYNLTFLDELVAAGTEPEVTQGAARIRGSVAELSSNISEVVSTEVRAHAVATLQTLESLSRDQGVQADCSVALSALNRSGQPGIRTSLGIASSTHSGTGPSNTVESLK